MYRFDSCTSARPGRISDHSRSLSHAIQHRPVRDSPDSGEGVATRYRRRTAALWTGISPRTGVGRDAFSPGSVRLREIVAAGRLGHTASSHKRFLLRALRLVTFLLLSPDLG